MYPYPYSEVRTKKQNFNLWQIHEHPSHPSMYHVKKSFHITKYQSYQSGLRYWKSVKYFQRKAESEFYQLGIIIEPLAFETIY